MKALFLGLGGVGQRHLRNLRALRPDARLAAVRHGKRTFEITDQLRADDSVNIMTKYEIADFPTIAAAVDTFAPDFAVVSSPSSVHVTQTIELLKSGVPVFLEKPISTDQLGLDEISALLDQGRGPVMVGYMLRFNPAVQKIRQLVTDGVLGKLYSGQIVAHTYMPDWHSYEAVDGFYAGRKDLGGGVVLTNIHLIDLMVWLLGQPKALWTLGGAKSTLNLDVEDSTVTLLDYDAPVTFHLSFVQKPIENSIALHGEKGCVWWNLGTASVTFEDGAGGIERFDYSDFEWNRMFAAELSHFMQSLDAKTKPDSAYQDVLQGHRVALAMKRSLESAEPVMFQ